MSLRFDDLRFMQLSGNCACIGYLGKNRLKGPIDNVVTNGSGCIELLLSGQYYNSIVQWADKAIVSKRNPNFIGDSDVAYKFKYVQIVHNNPTLPAYQAELQKRYNIFLNFFEAVKTDQVSYFTINLNENDVDRITHKLNRDHILGIIDCLKKYNILHKVIFISTKHRLATSWWNFYSDEFNSLANELGLKHIIITDLDYTENTYNQFYKKVEELIRNGIN